MKSILSLLVFLMSFPSLGDPSRNNWQCPQNDITPKEFVEKNEDIIRVMMFSGGSSLGNFLIVESLKGKYPINHQFQMSFENDDFVSADQGDKFNEVYWGIPKVNYEQKITGDRKNCLLASKLKEVKEELKIWKLQNLSKFDLAVEDSNLPEIEKAILLKQFRNKDGKLRFDSMDKLLEISADLSIRAFENGYPLESPEESFLLSAVLNEQVEVVKYLLKKKVNLNFTIKKNGISPLFVAVGSDNYGIVELLLNAGASAKPVGPLFQNPLCNIGGASRVKSNQFKSNLLNNSKIAKLLLERGATPNSPCNSIDKIKPIERLRDFDFHPVWKILMDHGVKVDSFSTYQMPNSQWFLYKNGVKPDESAEPQIKAYLQMSDRLKGKDVTTEEVNKVFLSSSKYGDFPTFRQAADKMQSFNANVLRDGTKNIVDCSTSYLRNSSVEFTKLMKEKGFKLNSSCKDGNSTEPGSIIHGFISDCRYDLLRLADVTDVSDLKVTNEMINILFDNWDFKSINSHYKCIETSRVLVEKNVVLDRNHLLRKILEVNSRSLLDYAFKNGVVEKKHIQNALDIYARENSLLPQTTDFSSRAISAEIFEYLKELAKKEGIESYNFKVENLPQFVFVKGNRYPICSISSEAPAYKRKKETVPLHMIPSCAELNGENLIYFEVYDITDEWLVLIAIVDFNQDKGELRLGSKVYVKPTLVGTPFYLTDGTRRIPLTKAGLRRIDLAGSKFQVDGSEDICKGVDQPILNTKDKVSDGDNLPEGVNVKKIKLDKIIGRKIKALCN